MNQFQRNVLFIAAAAILIVAVSFGLYFGITSHLAEQAKVDAARQLAWHNENIRQLKELSEVGVFSDEEQKRLDAAGDDPERMQQALLDIHQGRATLWKARLDDAEERATKLRILVGGSPYEYGGYQEVAASIRKDDDEARSQLSAFATAYHNIEAWRPMTFEQYQARLKGGSSPAFTTNPPPSEQAPAGDAPSVRQTIDRVTPAADRELSPSLETENTATPTTDDVSTITEAVNRYASAMLANDPDAEAKAYADHVDRYYLKSNVDNSFVREDKKAFLDHGNHITALKLHDLSVEDRTSTTASVRYVRDVTWVNGSTSTQKDIRSLLHLQKFGDAWKIVSEQDFR
jgi:ketosteroid isomerase-like protein